MNEAAIDRNVVRLFRLGVHAWLIAYIVSALPAYRSLWGDAISPCLPQPGIFSPITNMFCGWAGGYESIAIALLLIGCIHQLIRTPNAIVAFVIWAIHMSLMQRAWLAGSGGQQLIANMLFWLIFFPDEKRGSENQPGAMVIGAFWILRMQLLIAYAATVLHKFTGTHWIDRSALGIVVTDEAFGPAWLAGFPLMATIGTWSILLFQLTFPIAVWWKRTRVPWMIVGIFFHLATAIWLKIPDMAFAFIVCYAIWLDGSEASVILDRIRMPFSRSESERPERA